MPTKSAIKMHSETLEKGLKILDLFDISHRGIRLTDISATLGLNNTTVSRYVNTYCSLGILQRDRKTKLLHVGPRVIALAYSFLHNSKIVEAVRPLVDQAHADYGVHIDVGLLFQDSIYLAYRGESEDTQRFRHFASAGGLNSLAMGKAALAFLPEQDKKRILSQIEPVKMTARTIVEKEDLLQELNAVHTRGYSLSQEEFLPGLISIGAPLTDLRGGVIGGISFDSSTTRFTMERFEQKYAHVVMELSKGVSALFSQKRQVRGGPSWNHAAFAYLFSSSLKVCSTCW